MPQWADSEPSVHSRAAPVHCDDNTPAVRNGRGQHPQTKGPSARPDGIPRRLARHAVMGAPPRAIRAQTDATSLVLLGNRLYPGQPRDDAVDRFLMYEVMAAFFWSEWDLGRLGPARHLSRNERVYAGTRVFD